MVKMVPSSVRKRIVVSITPGASRTLSCVTPTSTTMICSPRAMRWAVGVTGGGARVGPERPNVTGGRVRMMLASGGKVAVAGDMGNDSGRSVGTGELTMTIGTASGASFPPRVRTSKTSPPAAATTKNSIKASDHSGKYRPLSRRARAVPRLTGRCAG